MTNRIVGYGNEMTNARAEREGNVIGTVFGVKDVVGLCKTNVEVDAST